jgi:hypothetical protein
VPSSVTFSAHLFLLRLTALGLALQNFSIGTAAPRMWILKSIKGLVHQFTVLWSTTLPMQRLRMFYLVSRQMVVRLYSRNFAPLKAPLDSKF